MSRSRFFIPSASNPLLETRLLNLHLILDMPGHKNLIMAMPIDAKAMVALERNQMKTPFRPGRLFLCFFI